MGRRKTVIDRQIKLLLGFSEDEPDADVMKKWKRMATLVCKPCWELKYCPYGPLVEQMPLLPPARDDAAEHNEYLKECLRTGVRGDGRPLDDAGRQYFEKMVAEYAADDYPVEIPQAIAEMQCTVFGHICPVIFAAEGFTETSEGRRVGRYIPLKTKLRVVRRDNYTCQHCGQHLLDDEVEFDHVIPVGKGGSSEEHNIRLTCFACNRDKSDKVEL